MWLVVAAAVPIALGAPALAGDDRFTVCSITINSDDEIRTFRKHLPPSRFRFVELTDHAGATAGDGGSWLGRACASGVRCDVLVLSAHFGNTWAGSYGTTFAGRSGHTLALEELEARRCEASCAGLLGDPLEVFLFGCQTLATALEGSALPATDLAVLARHGVAADEAAILHRKARHGSAGASHRARMRFVFSGVPHLYGFTEVAPSGRQVAPLLDRYLHGVGDYAAHLRRLRDARERSTADGPGGPNLLLARALEPTCFVEARGFAPAGPEAARAGRTCALASPRRPLAARLERLRGLLDEPGFVSYLPAIDTVLRARDPAAADPVESAAFERIRAHDRARAAVGDLLHRLETPALRLAVLRLGLTTGWVPEEEALVVARQVVLRLLQPPMWGEARDRICALGPGILRRIDLRAEDVPPETYANEFGIQALACLAPSDERIHERLARSRSDSREWIARLATGALARMRSPWAGAR